MTILGILADAQPTMVDQSRKADDVLTSPVTPMNADSFSVGPSIVVPFLTVTAAFYHQATSHPSATAARDHSGVEPREISYAALAKRSQELASRLRSAGIGPGDRVPLLVKRGIEMLVGIFAVLSCGAQYVPLDGGVVPDSTLRAVLGQADKKLAVCIESTAHRIDIVAQGQCDVIIIDPFHGDEEPDQTIDGSQVVDHASPGGGCYVIYTSGTTGVPKGVDVSHSNVTNLICTQPGNLGITTGTRVGQVLNISFDMAAWEILGCLCNGGTLILRGSDWRSSLQQVDVLICTPTILSKYSPADYPNIRTVATAGEPSWQSLADVWASHGTYYNCCGPTETTIVNTMHKHSPGQTLSIGRPTPNNNVYILDDELHPLSVGRVGVLWAGGQCVSRGYVGLPDKTAERYKLDCFAKDGTMMYNTGDLGCWRPDGSIEILGRLDDQIKIKGFRVELDGVSASLSAAPSVSRAIALLIEDEIHGFVEGSTVDLAQVKEHMRKNQPYYAMPGQFHVFEVLPCTENGKVDKRALRQFVENACEKQIRAAYENEKSSPASLSTVSVKLGPSPSTPATHISDVPDEVDLDRDPPEKSLSQPFRGLKHRIFIVYRFLFSVVGILNLVALTTLLGTDVDRSWLGTMVAINLLVAVLDRQDFIVNALYTITCSVPKSWPLSLRAACAKIYHLGGVHSGAAFCAGAWLLASNISNIVCQLTTSCGVSNRRQSAGSVVVSWMLTVLFCVMFTFAWPAMRKARHNLFERVHRFVGWTMLILFWVQTFLSIEDARSYDTYARTRSFGRACVTTLAFWLLVMATSSIATSWLFLRRVPVDAEVLSTHAVHLHFAYTVPVNGTFVRLSRRPLLEWHSFATIPAPQPTGGYPRGFSLVVSNAGDWTRDCITNPPTHLYVRGVPTCGVMRIATLFNRLVVVATGSGIGPLLGHVQNPSCPTRLIWSAQSPERTFGPAILDAIRTKIPGTVIHDTKILGRPDLVKMAYNVAKGFRAEAVIVIANEKITKKIVYGLETRGVYAYGAIWDS